MFLSVSNNACNQQQWNLLLPLLSIRKLLNETGLQLQALDSHKHIVQGFNSILSPWYSSSCSESLLIRLLAEPESINTSLLIPPIFTEITGSVEFDIAHVCSSIVKANVPSSPDCLQWSSTWLAFPCLSWHCWLPPRCWVVPCFPDVRFLPPLQQLA